MNHVPSFTLYIYGRLGQLKHLEGTPGFETTTKVMEKMGLSCVEFDRKTSMPYEDQLWEQFDLLMQLTEEGMMKELPLFVVDPSNKAKVEALMAGRKEAVISQESSKKLA